MTYKYLISILLIISTSASFLGAEEVKLGYFINDPHITTNSISGKPEGILVDFLEKIIAPEMGVTFKFIHQPLARTLNSMEFGIIDGAVLFGYTRERAAKFNYPQNSFFKMQSTMVLNIDNPLTRISSIEDIKNLNISYAIDAIVTPFIKNSHIQMYMMSGNDPLARNLKKLQERRTDAVFWPDMSSVIYTLNKLNMDNLKILTIPEDKIELYTIFSKATKNQNLAIRYDKAFQKVDGTNLYNEMVISHIN